MHASSQIAIAFAFAAVSSVAIAAPPIDDLVCPPQTVYKRIELKEHGVYSEGCRDDRGLRQGLHRFRRSSDGAIASEHTFVDGKEHGVGRVYNADGELLHTTTYADGSKGQVDFTRAGWVEVARLANEQLSRDGKQVVVSVSGRGGLLAEHTLKFPRPAKLPKQLFELDAGPLHAHGVWPVPGYISA